ncbi:MAG: ChaN family lipoprotein [Bacteroidota bacterium]
MKTLLLLLSLMVPAVTMAQANPEPYKLFNQKGKKTKYKKLLKAAQEADVILFGEIHNNAIAHWLQHTLVRDLTRATSLSLGLEMFETDQRQGLTDYLAGEITVEELDEIGSGVWSNFKTDYQPMVDFVSQEGLAVVATNVPRRYASLVFQEGFAALDNLSETEKAYLPPLPVPYDAELPAYVRMLEMMPEIHTGATFPMAQAIKDATMAYSITQHRKDGVPFLHLNGSYHSDDFEGIGWYLKQYAPELKVVTITTIEQENIAGLLSENIGKAHFTLATPSLMTKTY